MENVKTYPANYYKKESYFAHYESPNIVIVPTVNTELSDNVMHSAIDTGVLGNNQIRTREPTVVGKTQQAYLASNENINSNIDYLNHSGVLPVNTLETEYTSTKTHKIINPLHPTSKYHVANNLVDLLSLNHSKSNNKTAAVVMDSLTTYKTIHDHLKQSHGNEKCNTKPPDKVFKPQSCKINSNTPFILNQQNEYSNSRDTKGISKKSQTCKVDNKTAIGLINQSEDCSRISVELLKIDKKPQKYNVHTKPAITKNKPNEVCNNSKIRTTLQKPKNYKIGSKATILPLSQKSNKDSHKTVTTSKAQKQDSHNNNGVKHIAQKPKIENKTTVLSKSNKQNEDYVGSEIKDELCKIQKREVNSKIAVKTSNKKDAKRHSTHRELDEPDYIKKPNIGKNHTVASKNLKYSHKKYEHYGNEAKCDRLSNDQIQALKPSALKRYLDYQRFLQRYHAEQKIKESETSTSDKNNSLNNIASHFTSNEMKKESNKKLVRTPNDKKLHQHKKEDKSNKKSVINQPNKANSTMKINENLRRDSELNKNKKEEPKDNVDQKLQESKQSANLSLQKRKRSSKEDVAPLKYKKRKESSNEKQAKFSKSKKSKESSANIEHLLELKRKKEKIKKSLHDDSTTRQEKECKKNIINNLELQETNLKNKRSENCIQQLDHNKRKVELEKTFSSEKKEKAGFDKTTSSHLKLTKKFIKRFENDKLKQIPNIAKTAEIEKKHKAISSAKTADVSIKRHGLKVSNKDINKLDLRTLLIQKRAKNQGFSQSKRFKTGEHDNLIITLQQDVSANPKPTKVTQISGKSKVKTKRFKLVVNIECCSDELNSTDETDTTCHSTSPYQDLSFLDDFNVDEIVDSLNVDQSRLNVKKQNEEPQTPSNSQHSLRFIQDLNIKKDTENNISFSNINDFETKPRLVATAPNSSINEPSVYSNSKHRTSEARQINLINTDTINPNVNIASANLGANLKSHTTLNKDCIEELMKEIFGSPPKSDYCIEVRPKELIENEPCIVNDDTSHGDMQNIDKLNCKTDVDVINTAQTTTTAIQSHPNQKIDQNIINNNVIITELQEQSPEDIYSNKQNNTLVTKKDINVGKGVLLFKEDKNGQNHNDPQIQNVCKSAVQCVTSLNTSKPVIKHIHVDSIDLKVNPNEKINPLRDFTKHATLTVKSEPLSPQYNLTPNKHSIDITTDQLKVKNEKTNTKYGSVKSDNNIELVELTDSTKLVCRNVHELSVKCHQELSKQSHISVNNPKVISRENLPNITRENPSNISRENLPNISLENPPNISLENPPNISLENPPNISRRNPPNISQGNPPNILQENPLNISRENTPNIIQESKQNNSVYNDTKTESADVDSNQKLTNNDAKSDINVTNGTNNSDTNVSIQKTTNTAEDKPKPMCKSVKDQNLTSTKEFNVEIHRTMKNCNPNPIAVNKITEPKINKNKTILERGVFERINENITVTGLIHKGFYSSIYKYKDDKGETFAIKALKYQFINKGMYRDKMLLSLNKYTINEENHILQIKNSLIASGRYCLMTDFYPKNLANALKEYNKGFHINLVQILAKQLFSAVTVLSDNQIIHSDIHPKHILLDSTNTKLKLCGFDRCDYHSKMRILPSTGTPSYRAPEAILGFSPSYGVDVWATALVIFEMVTQSTLFPGRYNNEILFKQLCTLGNIDHDMLKQCTFRKIHFSGTQFLLRNDQKRVLIPSFQSNNTLYCRLIQSYTNDWLLRRRPWEVTKDMYKMEKFYMLLNQMLSMDPRNRLPIILAESSDFIRDI